MKKSFLLLCFLATAISVNYAQTNTSKAFRTTRGNFQKATFGAIGDNYSGSTINNSPLTIFASGLWIGGFNQNKELQSAVMTYRQSGTDFITGPLNIKDNSTVRKEKAAQYDKIWAVTRHETEAHIADLKDGKLDSPIPNIMAWPAEGNPYFEKNNGFKLAAGNLAPFKDADNNGLYDPSKGDYPYTSQTGAALPEELFWSVFNDATEHTITKGKAMNLEFQQTGWSYFCSDNPALNKTTFLSYKVINQGTEKFDSTYIGYWADFDIGCYNDDYVGCSPSKNSFFAYNANDKDGSSSPNGCPGGVESFPNLGAATSSVTFLNQSMHAFIYYLNGGIGTPVPATSDPASAADYYNFLNARWRDNTPLTKGGMGYNPISSASTKFAFPDDPFDATGWSMKSLDLPSYFDRRALGSIKIGTLAAGASTTFDIAITTHQDLALNSVKGQTSAMYDNIDNIQNAYNQQFKSNCKTITPCTATDCVYPGDANKDGTANVYDYLTLAMDATRTGEKRTGTSLWHSTDATDWNGQSSIGKHNLKHLDCDGNGIITDDDKQVILDNYNSKNATFKASTDVFKTGKDIFLEPSASLDVNKANADFLYYKVNLFIDNVQTVNDNLRGIACQIEYDNRYFSTILPTPSTVAKKLHYTNTNNNTNVLDFVFIKNMNTKTLLEVLRFTPNPTILKSGLASLCTTVKIKNIQGIKMDNSIVTTLGAQEIEICFDSKYLDVRDASSVGQAEKHILVQPNPIDHDFQVKNLTDNNLRFELFDIQGRMLQTGTLDAQLTRTISASDLSKGIYLLKTYQQNDVQTMKLVK